MGYNRRNEQMKNRLGKGIISILSVLMLSNSLILPIFGTEVPISEDHDCGNEAKNEVADETASEDISLNYIYLEHQILNKKEEQHLVVSLLGIDGNVEEATLYCTMGLQNEVSIPLQQNVGQALQFTYIPEESGIYTPVRLVYSVSQVEYTMNLTQEVDTSLLQFEVIDDSVIAVGNSEDEDYIAIDENAFVAYEEVCLDNLESIPAVTSKNGPIVIVLDPGHDSQHIGAQGNGLREEDVNLSIANYCKEELEKYNNVIVYMTRTDGSCLNSTSNGACLQARVAYAKSVNADLLVSIHADASTNSSAKGSLAIVAGKSGFNDDVSQITRDAGAMIQEELTKLGLSSRGLYIRWSESSGEEYIYPNGATADWYSITRNSMRAGLPGIIIEHGFITNPQDASQFLSSEVTRRELGVADAIGIANYFGLTKGTDVYDTLTDESTELYTEDTPDIAGFIRNLYESCLDRNPTRAEVSAWLKSVAREHLTGGELTAKFVWSQEFQNKQLSNEEFVEKLYHIYLGRASDPQGKQAWVNQLNSGVSKAEVIQGFELSVEFHNTCAYYGIAQTGGVTKNAKLYTEVADFVADYYRGFLGREPEEEGLEAWTTVLVNGGTAADLTRGFVFSREFMDNNMGSDEFVECLYNTYLQRPSEPSGKQAWVSLLPTMSQNEKENVIRGFLYSEEYRNRCKQYGIDVGSL